MICGQGLPGKQNASALVEVGAPALQRRERLYTLAFLGSAIPLFLGGCYLAWVSIPNFVHALLALTPAGSTNLINANEYILFAV